MLVTLEIKICTIIAVLIIIAFLILQVTEGIRVTGSEKQLLDDKLHAIMAEEVRYTLQLTVIGEE